ncbi:MAG: glycosyltransferase [Gammaproteobacteria bacterium]|nr:glycosyltransferase [Gammaproteobacteria bacterium]
MLVSIIIRTYNEERHLSELLAAIRGQEGVWGDVEIIIVDSGSTDRTLPVAESFNCRITHISKKDFTFGRSLNQGCLLSRGEILVFISGHCVPQGRHWLTRLIEPLVNSDAVYSYGRQLGRDTTKFSEYQVFEKYYPSESKIPQEGFFCNNANAALMKSAWKDTKFDEGLTGLEDMHLARRLVGKGSSIAYVAEAGVYHIHHETWRNIKVRYERESLALRKIMPELQLGLTDVVRYYFAAVTHDLGQAAKRKVLLAEVRGILIFRFVQYWGTYKGNHRHRKLSARRKEAYFYPKN